MRLVRSPQFLLSIPEHRVIVVHHVVVVPDGLEIVAREGVGVEHPAECLRNETPTHILALLLGRDTKGTKYRSAVSRLGPLVFLATRGNAPVDVPVPVCDAQRDTLVEVSLGCAL